MGALGLLIVAYGMIFGYNHGVAYLISVIGAVIVLGSLYGWALEPSTEPESPHQAETHTAVLAGVGAATAAGVLEPGAPSGAGAGGGASMTGGAGSGGEGGAPDGGDGGGGGPADAPSGPGDSSAGDGSTEDAS